MQGLSSCCQELDLAMHIYAKVLYDQHSFLNDFLSFPFSDLFKHFLFLRSFTNSLSSSAVV